MKEHYIDLQKDFICVLSKSPSSHISLYVTLLCFKDSLNIKEPWLDLAADLLE